MGHSWLKEWAKRHCRRSIASFHGTPEQFETPAGTVTGRVHYFVGLAKAQRQQTPNQNDFSEGVDCSVTELHALDRSPGAK
jgi:hypothetical protein